MGLQRDMHAMVGSKPVAPSSGATPTPDELPRISQRETLFTMAGVLLVMLLASLDQTIVGTALPRMIADLKGFSDEKIQQGFLRWLVEGIESAEQKLRGQTKDAFSPLSQTACNGPSQRYSIFSSEKPLQAFWQACALNVLEKT
jgi:hypothetical protein